MRCAKCGMPNEPKNLTAKIAYLRAERTGRQRRASPQQSPRVTLGHPALSRNPLATSKNSRACWTMAATDPSSNVASKS
jgi:hypothetical protein